MKILVVGQGGREHALVKALKINETSNEVHCLPGSLGISEDATCYLDIKVSSSEVILNLCKEQKFDYVIIGPEDPLVFGLSDLLRKNGILVVGPSQTAAQLEGSKVFSKKFMSEFGVSTSSFKIVSSVEETMEATTSFTPPYVLKADGLCAGKGVYICKTSEQLKNAAELFFDQKIFGDAGSSAVIEQFLPGYELSVLVLTNGTQYEILPLAQDHKQLLDGDEGPNTGGMGTVAPMNVDPGLMEQIRSKIILPTLQGFQKNNFIYRGVVFFGIMVTSKGPMCLEYNVRFGDPETQVIMPLLDGSWSDVFYKLSQGEVVPMNWKKNQSACCVVLAAEGYPDQPKKGAEIFGLENLKSTQNLDQSYILHAGTSKNQNQKWITNGGRVLNSVAVGSSVLEARAKAYEQSDKISWVGLQKRKDIGLRKNSN